MEERFVYAGFWHRAAAYWIDGLVLGVLFVLFDAVLATIATPEVVTGLVRGPLGYWVSTWFYYAMMESSRLQATVGKWLVGLRTLSDDGTPLTFGDATARHYSKLASCFTLGVGFLMAGWTPRKQALHDRIARTIVVRTGSPRSQAAQSAEAL